MQCERLLEQYREDGVDNYIPESKLASMNWWQPRELIVCKVKTRLSVGKVLAIIFWDFKGVELIVFLHDEVKQAYRWNTWRIPIGSMILLHDNARSHTAALTKKQQKFIGQNLNTHLTSQTCRPVITICLASDATNFIFRRRDTKPKLIFVNFFYFCDKLRVLFSFYSSSYKLFLVNISETKQ